MSEISNNSSIRIQMLSDFSRKMIEGENGAKLYKEYRERLETIIPHDVISAFDNMILENIPMDKIKTGVNKILNILYKTIQSYPAIPTPPNTILSAIADDNAKMETQLKEIRPLIKLVSKGDYTQDIINELKENFTNISLFNKHYIIKENILFPMIENSWTDYRCLQIMWSFHDDIRRNLKTIISILDKNELDLKQFNRHLGDIYFNMLNIKFREEKILFPRIIETIENEKLVSALAEAVEIGFPFINNEYFEKHSKSSKERTQQGKVNLNTGFPTPEQIRLIFNHLPVDITYVDENDEVVFFSTPKHRIFPRSNAVIGRKVHNCHPPESVKIVEQIVESFRAGERDVAKFWINIMNKFILIQYFAVRDNNGNYKGVVEVSQDATEIRALEGEQRLLDWE